MKVVNHATWLVFLGDLGIRTMARPWCVPLFLLDLSPSHHGGKSLQGQFGKWRDWRSLLLRAGGTGAVTICEKNNMGFHGNLTGLREDGKLDGIFFREFPAMSRFPSFSPSFWIV